MSSWTNQYYQVWNLCWGMKKQIYILKKAKWTAQYEGLMIGFQVNLYLIHAIVTNLSSIVKIRGFIIILIECLSNAIEINTAATWIAANRIRRPSLHEHMTGRVNRECPRAQSIRNPPIFRIWCLIIVLLIQIGQACLIVSTLVPNKKWLILY